MFNSIVNCKPGFEGVRDEPRDGRLPGDAALQDLCLDGRADLGRGDGLAPPDRSCPGQRRCFFILQVCNKSHINPNTLLFKSRRKIYVI